MARKISTAQMKSKMRQQVNKYNQAINNYNRKVKQAVNKYNQAVRQHNAKVMQNRSRIQSELRKLNSTRTIRITNTYSTSVSNLNTVYQQVAANYDSLDYGSPFQEYVYSTIEQENANNLSVANVVLDNSEPEDNNYSSQDSQIINQLSQISTDLDNRWRGALFSLSPQNPDATRHFCTSAREIFTEIFDKRAKDKDVFAVFPNCDKTPNGNATRRCKIKYFLHKKGLSDNTLETFVESDIDNILELFHTLSTGTHGEAGRYTMSQLGAIKKRVEDGLAFLCEISI
jgi:hypothetical protein